MAQSFPLEDFGVQTALVRSDAPTDASLEVVRSQGYEEGYQSGWDDAVSSGQDRDQRISEEFARNLQDLGFTYHEARAHVVSSVSGLLEDLVDVVFPSVLSEAIGHHFLQALQENVDTLVDGPIQITVSPSDADGLSSMIDEATTLPVKIVVEDALVPGQAYFKLGVTEQRVDLDRALHGLRTALEGVKQANAKVLKHG
ncbi:MAG: hypothetical protein AAFN59_12790 [Pseudomonadota bacterium]